MKKIPTLFKKVYENHKIVNILPEVTPGMEWVLEGEGLATVKFDGACCAIINGELFKRYDCKKGKKPPVDAIKCCDPDPVTGHWPHWIKVDPEKPEDKWFAAAFDQRLYLDMELTDGTYEAIGPHFQGNPYECYTDVLIKHGLGYCYPERSFEGIRQYLMENAIEGLVFWKDGEPQCKIKRTDFGLPWPVKKDVVNEC